MIFKNFKNFILAELIFPKTLIVNRPGIIINKTVRKFGKGNIQTRTAYYFEDIYSGLYLDSLKKMGKDRVDFLWYKIGKDSALRYLSFFGSNKSNDKNIGLVLEYSLNAIKSTGFSFIDSFCYDSKKKSLEVFGKDNVICRKTGSGSLVAGIVAGIMTYFQGRNFEAEASCNKCPNSCKVVSHLGMKEKYIPNIEELSPMKKYASLNFDSVDYPSNLSSFEDLIRFNKVKISGSESKIFLQDKAVLTSEIGLGDLFLKNYFESGELNLFESSMIKTSASLFRDLTSDKDYKYKLKFVSSLISGFGWGVPHFKKNRDVIILTISNPPITRYGVSHVRYVINGFLNEIYGKIFNITSASDYKIIYEC